MEIYKYGMRLRGFSPGFGVKSIVFILTYIEGRGYSNFFAILKPRIFEVHGFNG